MPLLHGPDGPMENDGPERGNETALYCELLPIAAAFDKWLASNQKEFWCPEDESKAEKISGFLDELKTDLDVKF